MHFYNISSDCYPYYAFSTRICETTYDDGFLHNEQGHPRAAGTFPRLIDKYVKTGKLSLYDAINKMTTMQAKKLGLSNKGNLSKGSDADITIFSYDEIKDNATFDNPIKKPDGIKYVLIKGSVALKDGEIVNGKLGTSVRR